MDSLREEVAPLIQPDGDEASAVRFDALMYGIELAYLAGKKYSKARSDLFKRVERVASIANIPEIQAQEVLINKILHTGYVENGGINEFEEIRKKLRGLMKYIPNDNVVRYITNSKTPVSGAALAKSCEVSRQVIVQDIALLRAVNKNILSTNKGYVLYDHLNDGIPAHLPFHFLSS